MNARITEMTATPMPHALIQLVLSCVPVSQATQETVPTAPTLMNVTLIRHRTTVQQMQPVLITTAHFPVLVIRDTPEMEQSV